MSVLVVYKNNEALRLQYYRLNNLTHVTAVRTFDGKAWEPFVCREDIVGFREGKPLPTLKAVKEWAKEFAPELEWIKPDPSWRN